MKIENRKINKKIADDILTKNSHNRKVVRANVDFIKDEMANGRFVQNGQTISIAEDGTLLDGQHRLMAISELDNKIDMIVVSNLDKKSFSTIDTGRTRRAGDVLSIENIKNANSIASAIKRIIVKFDQERKISKTGTFKISNGEILDFYLKNQKELSEHSEFCINLYSSEVKILTPAVGIAMLFLLTREDKRYAKDFIEEIFTGDRCGQDGSAITLRKRLLNLKLEGKKTTDTIYRNLFLTAFNGYCNHLNLTKITIIKNKMFK